MVVNSCFEDLEGRMGLNRSLVSPAMRLSLWASHSLTAGRKKAGKRRNERVKVSSDS